MKLTEEQQSAVNEDENCLVKACPGSGKTRAIIAKLLKVCDEAEDTPRKVACITYTNTAVQEISRRIKEAGGLREGRCEISTIHTFCLNNVLRPFSHLLGDEVPKNFGILGPDSPELFEIGGDLFGGQVNAQRFRDLLMNIKRQDDGIFFPQRIPEASAQEFYDRIRERGLLTFGDIVYFSEKLIAGYAFIQRSLASRFYRIIVDEFQDTSPEQASILMAIARIGRSRLMLVGDENQSILSFSDARPDIFRDFAENADFPILEKTFTGNFRCSALIVDAAEKICPRYPAMESVGEDRDYRFEVSRYQCASALNGIMDEFLPAVAEAGISLGNCAILAPQWFELRPLGRRLASRGVPVVGPGARPYRRASEFTNVAEAAAECAVSPSVDARLRLERALTFCLMTVNRGQYNQGDRFSKRKAVCLIRRKAAELYDANVPAMDWLSQLAEFSAETLHSLSLISADGMERIASTAAMMASQIQEHHRNEDVGEFGLNELAIFSNPKDSVELCTIHSAKGLEWDAVALIDLHEGKLPHQLGDINESRRLFYVGCTRAKKILMLFTDRGEPSRFLSLLD